VISIVMNNTGAGTVTPPAVGMCASESFPQVVRMAPVAAPFQGTGLPIAGSATPIRLRGLTAAAGTTGIATGELAHLSVQTTAVQHFAVAGVPARQISTTPGDLPPEDPLS
jgi:hypothetical protein